MKSLALLLAYELCMIVFHLDGLSLGKLLITIFVWISFGLTLRLFITDFQSIKNQIPSFVFVLILLLLCWNIINIIRTILFDSDSITTIFGNTFTSLALLVPFAFVYGTKILSIRYLNRIFVLLLQTGLVLFFVFLIFRLGGALSVDQTLVLLLILQPVVFLITILHFQRKTKIFLILICAIILLYMAYLYSVRTMGIREFLLFICFIGVYLYHRFKWKWVLYVSFLTLAIPFLMVQESIITGESAIKKYLSRSADDDLSIDTRTFVYIELYADLVENGRLLIGKGANGRYYSDYFSQVEGDAPIRLNIEVGVLGLLLKGGYIAVVLNLALFISAIYFAFFRSRNSYVIGMGMILLVHIVLLFIENVISYSVYNFLIWIVTGMCLSRNIRMLNNQQIFKILNT